MSDGVDVQAAAVQSAVAGIRTISAEWVGHSRAFVITGVGSGVSDETAEAVTSWSKELQAAGDGMSDVAIKVEADLAAFGTLDGTMVTSPAPEPRPR